MKLHFSSMLTRRVSRSFWSRLAKNAFVGPSCPRNCSAEIVSGYTRGSRSRACGWNYGVVRLESSAVDPLSETANTSSGTSPGDTIKGAFQSAEKGSVSNYWGIPSKSSLREDGTSWPWHCFQVNLSLYFSEQILA